MLDQVKDEFLVPLSVRLLLQNHLFYLRGYRFECVDYFLLLLLPLPFFLQEYLVEFRNLLHELLQYLVLELPSKIDLVGELSLKLGYFLLDNELEIWVDFCRCIQVFINLALYQLYVAIKFGYQLGVRGRSFLTGGFMHIISYLCSLLQHSLAVFFECCDLRIQLIF